MYVCIISLSLSIYIYIYTYMYIYYIWCICVCVCVYIYIYIEIHTWIYIYIYIYVYTYWYVISYCITQLAPGAEGGAGAAVSENVILGVELILFSELCSCCIDMLYSIGHNWVILKPTILEYNTIIFKYSILPFRSRGRGGCSAAGSGRPPRASRRPPRPSLQAYMYVYIYIYIMYIYIYIYVCR